jgi:Fe-S-cluster containining protein
MCGRCCSNLRAGTGESGLTLFPDEIHVFPEEKVRPHYGKGRDLPSSIFTYQYIDNNCMYLVNNLCQVYEDRPLMCRKFPVKIGADGLTFSPGCIAVLNLLRTSKTMYGEQEEVQVAYTIAERLMFFNRGLENGESRWRYNLVSEAWEKMDL